MLIYVVWDVAYYAVMISKNRQKKIGFFALAFLLFILMACRSTYMGIGDARIDGIYGLKFSSYKSLSLMESINSSYSFEPLFTAYMWTLARIGNYRFFLIVSAGLSVASATHYIYHNAERPIYGLPIYFALLYFYNSFLIKQMLAIAIFLFAIRYLNERKLWKYLFFVMLTTMVHRSAIILILLYPACVFLKFGRKFFVIFIILAAIGAYAPRMILGLISRFGYSDYMILIRDGRYSTEGGINFSMILYPALTFGCYYFNRKRGLSSIEKDGYMMLFFACLFNCWSTVVVEFYRVALYFIYPILFILPNTYQNIKKDKTLIIAIVSLFFLIYALKVAANTNCLPYILGL